MINKRPAPKVLSIRWNVFFFFSSPLSFFYWCMWPGIKSEWGRVKVRRMKGAALTERSSKGNLGTSALTGVCMADTGVFKAVIFWRRKKIKPPFKHLITFQIYIIHTIFSHFVSHEEIKQNSTSNRISIKKIHDTDITWIITVLLPDRKDLS